MTAAITNRYKSLSPAGRVVRGLLPAANENDLYRQLHGHGLQLIAARESRERRPLLPPLPFIDRVSQRELIVFSLHLEQMLKAGMPLLACLAEAQELAESRTMRRSVGQLRFSLEQGTSFSQALAQQPRLFDRIYRGLIETGERGGDLAKPLGHIVTHLKWREALGRRIGQALRYPLFALISALASLISLLIIVVPQLTVFLDNFGNQLPFETRLLLRLSGGLQRHYLELAAGAGAILLGIVATWRFSAGLRRRLDQLLLHLPLLGAVIQKTALARFAHFTSLLLENGVELLPCLEITRRLLGNRYLAAALHRATGQVEAGWKLSAALQETQAFPRFFLQMVRVGEESGNLAMGFATVCEFYDRDAEDALARLTGSLQPTLILLVGLMLLWIVTAVLGPVYSSFSTLPL